MIWRDAEGGVRGVREANQVREQRESNKRMVIFPDEDFTAGRDITTANERGWLHCEIEGVCLCVCVCV